MFHFSFSLDSFQAVLQHRLVHRHHRILLLDQVGQTIWSHNKIISLNSLRSFRRVPSNFNESRFINLSMYSVCVAWIVEAIGWVFQEDLNNKDLVLHYNPEVRR
jgi:hypothetical protein